MVNGYHRIFLAYYLSYSHFQKTLYTSVGTFFPKTSVVIDDLTTVVSLNLLLHSFVAAAATRVDNIDSGPFQCLVFVFFGGGFFFSFCLFSFCLFACLFYFFLIVFNLVVSFWQKEIQVITGKFSFSLRITIIV